MADVIDLVGKRFGALNDLPKELKDELQIVKTNELDDQIIGVIDELYDSVANIDEILVGLFRKHGVLQKRVFLNNKLNRMAKAKTLFSIPKKKGVYTTNEVYTLV